MFETVNPKNEQPLKQYSFESTAEVESKISNSHNAYVSWRELSFQQRALYILKVAELLKANSAKWAQLVHREMGKPVFQAESEIIKCASVCEYYAEFTEQILADDAIEAGHVKSYVAYKPLGVIFAIMPWNFPFWQVLRFAIPTLMAGNTVIVKHSPNVTGCMLAIVDLFAQADFPEAVFQHVIIDLDLIEPVISNKSIAGVSITGSTRAGRSVAQLCGKYLKKCVLELGGSDAYLVLEDADLHLAARKIVQGRLLNSGQSCVSPKRLLVSKSVASEFVQLLETEIKNYLKVNSIGPLARKDLRDALHSQVTKSIKQGGLCVRGGQIPDGQGFFYPATVLLNIKPGMPAFDEELFGPVFSIIEYDELKQAVDWANASEFGLGGAVFSKNIKLAEDIAKNKLETGGVFVNDFLKSQCELPFGGIKNSGIGRELSDLGLKEFTNAKTIVIS